ncbi:MAG TPA: hypothetical protein VNL18_03245 [Gemmatimonadales bacterium]|nr:hypothetical protein [Gemmatimonadales bacterium]
MNLLAGGALLAALAAQQDPRGVLREAMIRVAVEDTLAIVDARYTVTGAASLDLLALRLEGQRVEVLEAIVGVRPIVLEERRTSQVLRVYRPPDSAAIRVLYRVTGRLARIPVFVPTAPTSPPTGAIRIVVTGAPAERRTSSTLPRFSQQTDGALAARPEHLPTVLALVRDRSELPVPAVSEWIIIGITVGGTALWILRLRRARRTAVETG